MRKAYQIETRYRSAREYFFSKLFIRIKTLPLAGDLYQFSPAIVQVLVRQSVWRFPRGALHSGS